MARSKLKKFEDSPLQGFVQQIVHQFNNTQDQKKLANHPRKRQVTEEPYIIQTQQNQDRARELKAQLMGRKQVSNYEGSSLKHDVSIFEKYYF